MRLIDADALKQKVEADFKDVIRNCVLIEINRAPTIDPVKHGCWIGRGLTDIQCSECGEYYMDAEPLFCPTCGAMMDGDEK